MRKTDDAPVPISTRLTARQINDLDTLAQHDPGKNTRAAQIRSAVALYLSRDRNLDILIQAEGQRAEG
jgi:hypothetical protein